MVMMTMRRAEMGLVPAIVGFVFVCWRRVGFGVSFRGGWKGESWMLRENVV